MSANYINFPEIYRGDVKLFALNFTDGQKKPIDLSNRTIYMTIKRNKYDPDSEAISQKVWTLTTNAVIGEFIVQISSTDTLKMEEGTYPADIRVSVANSPKQISMTLEGMITVEQPITLDILKEE